MYQHWVSKDEQREIIKTIKSEKGITVRRCDEKKLKYFTVKGEGLFRCYECGNQWSSHHSTIKVDLSRMRVFKLYKQRCHCEADYWAIPHFTSDRFKELITKAIQIYEEIKYGHTNDHHHQSVNGNTQGPHKMDDCERCKELGRHC